MKWKTKMSNIFYEVPEGPERHDNCTVPDYTPPAYSFATCPECDRILYVGKVSIMGVTFYDWKRLEWWHFNAKRKLRQLGYRTNLEGDE